MTLWLDAQLPPLLAGWINAQGWGLHAVAVRDVGMHDARDPEIFRAAKDAGRWGCTQGRGPLQWHLENVEATITGWSRPGFRPRA